MICLKNVLRSGYFINPLTAVPAKTSRTRIHCFKTLQLSQSCEQCFNCQLWALSRKVSAFLRGQLLHLWLPHSQLSWNMLLFYWSIWSTLSKCSGYTSHAVNCTALLKVFKVFRLAQIFAKNFAQMKTWEKPPIKAKYLVALHYQSVYSYGMQSSLRFVHWLKTVWAFHWCAACWNCSSDFDERRKR